MKKTSIVNMMGISGDREEIGPVTYRVAMEPKFVVDRISRQHPGMLVLETLVVKAWRSPANGGNIFHADPQEVWINTQNVLSVEADKDIFPDQFAPRDET